MIHPDTELKFINEKIGYGVVATKDIPKGSITWVMDKLDRSFSEKAIQRLGPHYAPIMKKYCFRDAKGKYVLCWDIARYVNHSFSPNCLTSAYDFEFAVREIKKGEQLTNHYGYLNLDPIELLSDDEQEIRVVSSEDILNNYEIWDEQLKESFQIYENLQQPLLPYLSPKMIRQLKAIKSNKKPIDSIKTCYFAKLENRENLN